MTSLRRINSSRANGARSGGPITLEGKEHSSANALRHGLLAKCAVLESESSECFDDLVTQHIQRFAPADGVEFGMVEEMAVAHWRMRRAPAAAPPNHAVPNEPNPISEHRVVQVLGGPDVQGLPAPPDSGVPDLPMLNCG